MADQIRLVDTSGTVLDRVTALDGSWYQEELGKKTQAKLRAPRSDIAALTLAEGDTKVYLNTDRKGDEFGGRLTNVLWRDEQAVLLADSFIKDAADAEPAGDGTGSWNYQNATDSKIINDTVDRVTGLSKGTINTVETGLSFRFSYVSQAKVLRTVEDVGDGELYIAPDASVDYVDTLGRDRTSITIEEGDPRLSGKFQVERAGDGRKINKLRAVGTGEGPGAITTDLTASGFSPGSDRAKWGVRVNRDISDSSTLTKFGNGILGELQSDFIEIETGWRNADLDLGDEYKFKYDTKGIDANLRATRVKTIIGEDGRRHDVTWSNRKKTRKTQRDELIESAKKSGRVINGFTVPLPVSAGPGIVSSNLNFRFSIPYPSDVLQEIKVDLRVRGLAEYDDDTDSTTSDFPENMDVKVNGTPQGKSFGDGTTAFTQTVDLTGKLTQGQINTIDLTSDRKARCYAVLDAEVYRTMVGT